MTRVLSLAFLLLASGCSPTLSIEPLWDRQHLALEPALPGNWATPDGEDYAQIKARGSEAGMYTVTYFDGRGVSCYDGVLVCLDQEMFLDLSPNPESLERALHSHVFTPVKSLHFFARLNLIKDRLSISFFPDESFEELAKTGAVTAPYMKTDHTLVLTATTEELQTLAVQLSKHEGWSETVFHRLPQ
jgi:hypothetical protein